jgi:hypothetical protein
MDIQCPLRELFVCPTAVGRRRHVRLVAGRVAAVQVMEVVLLALVLTVPLLKVPGV